MKVTKIHSNHALIKLAFSLQSRKLISLVLINIDKMTLKIIQQDPSVKL